MAAVNNDVLHSGASTGIRAYRERLGLTLEDVAWRIGVTAKTIWRLERRTFKRGPHDSTLQALAKLYQCDVEELRRLITPTGI